MTKIDLSNPYTSEPVKKKVQKYGGRPFGLENYCSGYCNGVKTLQQYPIINSKGKKSSAKDCFGKPRDFYEVSSTVYPESECVFVERMPSNTQNTLLKIKHSTREHIIYQDGREEIILDKPELRRVREKLNGKWALKEYAIKDRLDDEMLLFKDGKLLDFDCIEFKNGIKLSGLTKKEKEKLTKSIQKQYTKLMKNILRK